MDTAKVIDKLNEIMAWEWKGVIQYAQYSFLVSDVWREVYAPMFGKSSAESMTHAKLIGDKIVALGGIPTVEPAQVQQSTDLKEMLSHSLAFESGAVKHYTDALHIVGDSDEALRVLLEDILLEEQDGVDQLTKVCSGPERLAHARGKKASKAG